MKEKEKEMNLQKKIIAVANELKAPKDLYNSFGRYKYRSFEDIAEGLKPLLLKYSLGLVLNEDIVEVGGKNYIKASALIVNGDDDTDMLERHTFVREPEQKKGMDEAQISGATISYARKYLIGGIFLLDDTKDNDAIADIKKTSVVKKTEVKNAETETVTRALPDEIVQAGFTEEEIEKVVRSKYKKSFSTLDAVEYQGLLDTVLKEPGLIKEWLKRH